MGGNGKLVPRCLVRGGEKLVMVTSIGFLESWKAPGVAVTLIDGKAYLNIEDALDAIEEAQASLLIDSPFAVVFKRLFDTLVRFRNFVPTQ
jgi:hypothetical protein